MTVKYYVLFNIQTNKVQGVDWASGEYLYDASYIGDWKWFSTADEALKTRDKFISMETYENLRLREVSVSVD